MMDRCEKEEAAFHKFNENLLHEFAVYRILSHANVVQLHEVCFVNRSFAAYGVNIALVPS